jgi:hypothetical protein
MSLKLVKAPRLPTAPADYDREVFDNIFSIIRQYFNQLDNPGPVNFSTQRNPAVGSTPAQIFSALSCVQPSPTNPAQFVISLPTQADFANLRSGDIYYDTSGGTATSYPLRIKA